MKIVRKICCGMDIHKNLIVAAIAASGDNNVTTYIQNGLLTSLNKIFSSTLLFHLKTLENLEKYHIIALNLSISALLNAIVIKTV